jgi:UPF0716 family protein affecting phage T7 exclusion
VTRARGESGQASIELAGSLLLILPGLWSDLAGIACFLLVLVSQRAARTAGATEVV